MSISVHWRACSVAMFLIVGVSYQLVTAEELTENFIPSGVTARVGGYSPIRAAMDKEEDIADKLPEGLAAPKFGTIERGEKSWAFVLDEPEEGEARLFIDTNGDGDLTNDPDAEWITKTRGELRSFSGEGQLDLGDGQLGAVKLYRFDPNDERRASLKNTMLYYFDFGYEYEFKLDDQEFSTFVAGVPTAKSRLPIDRDGNGRISSRLENAKLDTPFNFTGSTYVFSLNEGKLTLDVADEEAPQMPLPPDLSIGKKSLEFSAKMMDGETVSFPKDYAGKIVMLDFWATWCGPCIGEIPNMKEAYADWHHAGFEILGISFDRADMEEKIVEFLEKRELTWPQIYDGKYWDTEIGRQHDVSGIPFVLLVDGDSGDILATAKQLRGKGLSDFVGKELVKKFGPVEKAVREPEADAAEADTATENSEAEKDGDN